MYFSPAEPTSMTFPGHASSLVTVFARQRRLAPILRQSPFLSFTTDVSLLSMLQPADQSPTHSHTTNRDQQISQPHQFNCFRHRHSHSRLSDRTTASSRSTHQLLNHALDDTPCFPPASMQNPERQMTLRGENVGPYVAPTTCSLSRKLP